MAEHSAYAVLGLQKGASDQEIKNAYVQLVKKYDPEVHTERFMLIQKAYDRLRDPRRRAKEDLLTYNMIPGEFRYHNDEKPADHRPPKDEKISKARDNYRQSSGDASAREELVRLLMQKSYVLEKRKMWNEAIDQWEEVVQADPSHVRARNNLLNAYITLGVSFALHSLEDDALTLWEKALQLNPDNVDLLHNMAVAAEKGSDAEKAARYWSEVINRWKNQLKTEPDNEYLRECLVEAHRHHGLQYQPPGAQQAGSPAGTPQPVSSSRIAASSSQVAQQRQTQAEPSARREQYEAVLELRPDDFDARFQLASSYIEERKYQEALQALQKLQQKHPKNVEVLNMMGWAQLNSGSVDKAFLTWNKALAIDKKNPSTRENIVKAHLTLGKQYRQKGMFTPALVHLKKLMRFLPDSAEVLMELAATYDMKGDIRSAQLHYEKVISLDPKNKLAKKALNDLRMRR